MRKFVCAICGYSFNESAGLPDKGIAPGTKWEDIGDDFVCPLCRAPKSAFSVTGEAEPEPKPAAAPVSAALGNAEPNPQAPAQDQNTPAPALGDLSAGEISAILSSLALGCEKQRLTEETEAFNKLAEYYKSKIAGDCGNTLEDVSKILVKDMDGGIAAATAAAKADSDRGALRSLVWSEKVSAMLKSQLDRFLKEGDAMLANTKIYVCDICGLIYTGDTLPEFCPVCKVPNFKILEVERS